MSIQSHQPIPGQVLGGVHQPPVAMAVNNPMANVFQGPGYTVYKAQYRMESWGKWVRGASHFLIGVSIAAIGIYIILILLGPRPIEIDYDTAYEYRYSWPAHVADYILKIGGSIIRIVQGQLALKAVRQRTRDGSWQLF